MAKLGVIPDTYGRRLRTFTPRSRRCENFRQLGGGPRRLPYAKGATGNVATEDVVYMLDGLGKKRAST